MSDDANINPVLVPQWGMSMVKGKVVTWLAEVGDDIDAGDETVELETDKIVNVVEANKSGKLRRIVAEEGQEYPVGALLAVLADDSVADSDIDAYVDGFEAPELDETGAGAAEAEPETVACGDLTIRYRVDGGGDNAPVVLIHGFGGDSENWLFNVPALSGDRKVVMPDLPGHGISSKTVSDGSASALAAAVAAVIADTAADEVHLVGHSLGAAVAMQYASENSARIKSLTIIGGAGLSDTVNAEFLDSYVAAERRKDMKAVAQMLFADASLVTREMVNNMLKFKRLEGVEDALKTIAAANFPGGKQSNSFRGAVEGFDFPIMAIWGSKDGVISAPEAGSLPSGIALHVLDGAGHMPQMEAAGDVNRLLAEHISSAD